MDFEERTDGIYVVWETPFGKQEINLSHRRFINDGKGKIKVVLGEYKEDIYPQEATRVVNLKDYSFKFKNRIFNLTEDEIEIVKSMTPAAIKEKSDIKEAEKRKRERQRKNHEAYIKSEEYKQYLIKRLESCRNTEKDLIRQLERLGWKEN